MDAIATLARVVHVLSLSIWLGGAALIRLGDARLALVLESRQHAETALSAARLALDHYGMLAAPVALVTLFLGWLPFGTKLRARTILLVALAALAVLGSRWISPHIEAALLALGRPLDELAAGDPGLAELARWLRLASWWLWAEMALAFVLLAWAARAAQPQRRGGILV